MENNNEVEKNHVYDGIVEQNNPMPSWWVALFILSCIFAFIYFIHYESGSGPTLQQEYLVDFKNFKEQLEKKSPPASTDTEETLKAYMNDESALHEGVLIYKSKCAMCHGEHLEGKIGPNLTDSFWMTGNGSRMAIVHTVTIGSPIKGMPPWQNILKPAEIKNVAAYIFSKLGSNPANPKAPEGVEVKK